MTEENADIQTLLAGTFALKGHQVFKAFNADQCLKIIAELNNQVDIVVMDGKTASDRGVMLIIKIKRLNSDIKIFAIADDENDKTRVLEYGAEEFAIKPISAETIVDKLANIFLKERQMTK
ncbi:MAG: response regulator [Nitrososphaeraceae archaeon]